VTVTVATDPGRRGERLSKAFLTGIRPEFL
jgi:hypothetical protein